MSYSSASSDGDEAGERSERANGSRSYSEDRVIVASYESAYDGSGTTAAVAP